MSTRPPTIALFVTLSALFQLTAACGAPCENVISAQRLIRDKNTGPGDGRPHAQLRLPHNRVNVLIESALASEEISATVPFTDTIVLPTAKANATRVELIRAEDGSVGFYVELELTLGETKLLGLSVEIAARTAIEPDGERTALVIGFDADSLRTVRPQFPDGAIDALATVVGPAIKAATGKTIPGPLLRPITRRMLAVVSGEAFELIRDQVLARIGEVAAIRVDLGLAPIDRVVSRTAAAPQPALVVDIYTRLPVRVGLGSMPSQADPISGTGRLRIAGEALAELGNWAIAEGHAPQTYDSKLRPDSEGGYVPVYAWRRGERPLVIHAFRIKSPCSTIVVGATPEVTVADGKINVGISDGSVEEVHGSTLMKLGVGLKSVFGGAIQKTESSAAHAAFEVGDRPVTARLINAALDDAELDLTVELSLSSP